MHTKYKLFLLLYLLPIITLAQPTEMADGLRADGKIYVVVVVLLIIFAVLITYLIIIDRKISRLEKKVREKNNL